MAVILGTWDGKPITISVKPNCLTVSIEKGGAEAEVFSYDYEGRLWTALLDGISYRRGLDGKIVAKWGSGETRSRRWVYGIEALQIEEKVRQQMFALYAAIQAGQVSLSQPLPSLGKRGFKQAVAFDAQRSQADAAQYHEVYKPVGILPPDQYMAVVLQATEGCAFNTCTFCDFYRDRPFRIKGTEDFRAHAEAVRDFIGAGMSLRRTIFLGDANALIAPMPRLLDLIEVMHAVFDVERLGGIYAFLDGFSGERKGANDYHLLAERGLQRVYIGMESGNQALLEFLEKPGKPADVVNAVRVMKSGGVAVGVIVLLGAGGHTYARDHVRDTIRAINAMNLDLHDIVYFSELFVSEQMEYVRKAYQSHLQPLTPEQRLAQGEAIEHGLKFSRRGGTPHISRYDIREFVY